MERGVRIVAPDQVDDGNVTRIKPVYVVDVTLTDPLARKDAEPTYAAAD